MPALKYQAGGSQELDCIGSSNLWSAGGLSRLCVCVRIGLESQDNGLRLQLIAEHPYSITMVTSVLNSHSQERKFLVAY